VGVSGNVMGDTSLDHLGQRQRINATSAIDPEERLVADSPTQTQASLEINFSRFSLPQRGSVSRKT